MSARRAAAGLAMVALLVSACASDGAPPQAVGNPDSPDEPSTSTALRPGGEGVCDDAPLPAPQTPGFDRGSSELTTRGEPRHGLTDAISVTGGSAPLAGRFQYGRLRLDLEGERVELWLDDCTPNARYVGDAVTDDDGVIETELPPLDLGTGRYAVHAVVAGDGTVASGVLAIVPGGTKVTVFDVDGTLTVGDRELAGDVLADFFESLDDDFVPEARSMAAEATSIHADRGRFIVYLTGRPVWLAELTRDWLEGEGAAAGMLRMPAHDADARPTEAGVATTKRVELERLTAAGLRIVDAYGNAETDVIAYLGAGIPPERVHILGPDAPPGVDALGEGFDEHNAALAGRE